MKTDTRILSECSFFIYLGIWPGQAGFQDLVRPRLNRRILKQDHRKHSLFSLISNAVTDSKKLEWKHESNTICFLTVFYGKEKCKWYNKRDFFGFPNNVLGMRITKFWYFLSFPTPQDSGARNPAHPQGECPHPETAVMSFAHCLNVLESAPHIPLKLHVNLLFIPHESLDVLPKSREEDNLMKKNITFACVEIRRDKSINFIIRTWTHSK